ncbi:hypothetical protein RJ639_000336 [Escallonia herrerae]|uniref:CRM domain-containing protein n=1 Tax=Escallonia herrerae TaxID=1293975 RepID=A0AA89BGT7_9ASTE|nr:hypothetical protein RJ639_000336 [Escallonia herrerae]
MAILATLPGHNLFTPLPTTSPPTTPTSHPPPQPPIPIPKYPPPVKSNKSPKHPPKSPPSPAFKTFHHRSKYYKPVRDGVLQSDGDRSIVVGESGLTYRLPGAPFEFQFSYSETPKAKPLAIREPAFLPFAPPTMPRPWTGKAPLKKSKKKIPLFESFNPPSESEGVRHLEMPGPYRLGKYPAETKSREEVLGRPLTKAEIKELVKPHWTSNRQVNLGRDGLTHNMLELIHSHWRRDEVCKVRCLGVPTVDMANVCRCLEEKTGGKIIVRVGGVIYLFRGRNYDHHTRPQYPVMLWKPATPVYPKLIQEAPEGLTKAEADELRMKGKTLPPICKLVKNGVYITLVKDVRNAFEGCLLVKINCTGIHASDYKKLGAKLKELVPCVLLSFDEEQILMWRGRNWKSMYRVAPSASSPAHSGFTNAFQVSENHSADSPKSNSKVSSSPKMMSLWKHAIESSKALLLDEICLGPDALLQKVEEFESISQATVHSYPALILSSEDGPSRSKTEYDEDSQSEDYDEDSQDEDYDEDETYGSKYDEYSINDSIPLGSLPVDVIAKQLRDNEEQR